MEDNWWLNVLGIGLEFAAILLNLELKDKRDYHTLDELVVDILFARWHTLESLDDCAREREAYLWACR